VGESIIIGSNIKVTVLGREGSVIRLGVNAPTNIEVHREEVFYRIINQKLRELGEANAQLQA